MGDVVESGKPGPWVSSDYWQPSLEFENSSLGDADKQLQGNFFLYNFKHSLQLQLLQYITHEVMVMLYILQWLNHRFPNRETLDIRVDMALFCLRLCPQ